MLALVQRWHIERPSAVRAAEGRADTHATVIDHDLGKRFTLTAQGRRSVIGGTAVGDVTELAEIIKCRIDHGFDNRLGVCHGQREGVRCNSICDYCQRVFAWRKGKVGTKRIAAIRLYERATDDSSTAIQENLSARFAVATERWSTIIRCTAVDNFTGLPSVIEYRLNHGARRFRNFDGQCERFGCITCCVNHG